VQRGQEERHHSRHAALQARARDAGAIEVLSKPLVSRDISRSLAGALER
jgi:hypothetical protein